MTFVPSHYPLTRCAKGLSIALLLSVLAACGSTTGQHVVVPAPVINTQRTDAIDLDCQRQATLLAQSAATTGSMPQYASAARYMQSCLIQPLPSKLNKSQSQAVMQLMANVTLNYMQGGDIAAAQQQLSQFDAMFPNQDLYLPDFSSFRDTATALLSGASMSSHQLASLNISRALRNELERQQYWLSH